MHRLCSAVPAVTFEPRTAGVTDELALCVGDTPLMVTCATVVWVPSFPRLGWPGEGQGNCTTPFGAVPERPSLKSELKSGHLFVQQACVEYLLCTKLYRPCRACPAQQYGVVIQSLVLLFLKILFLY